VSLYLAEKLNADGTVLGIDPSDSMMKEASKLADSTKVRNLSFLKGNALNIDYENEFDIITGFSSFNWIEDQSEAFKRLQKALKPGGKIYLLFNPDHGRIVDIDDSIALVIKQPLWASFLNDKKSKFITSSPKKLLELADTAGLLLDRMEIIPVHDRFTSRSHYVNFIQSWMDSLTNLPQDLRLVFVNEIVDDYLKKYPLEKDGSLIHHDYMMELVLYKQRNY